MNLGDSKIYSLAIFFHFYGDTPVKPEPRGRILLMTQN